MASDERVVAYTLQADSSIGIYTGPPGMPGSASPNNGKAYCFVKITGTRQVGLQSVAGAASIGVLYSKPQATGDPAAVAVSGIVKVLTDATATIVAGSPITSNAAGLAKVGVPGTDAIQGYALQGSTTTSQLISVLLRQP
jgi:hypothetical protein